MKIIVKDCLVEAEHIHKITEIESVSVHLPLEKYPWVNTISYKFEITYINKKTKDVIDINIYDGYLGDPNETITNEDIYNKVCKESIKKIQEMRGNLVKFLTDNRDIPRFNL